MFQHLIMIQRLSKTKKIVICSQLISTEFFNRGHLIFLPHLNNHCLF